MILEKLIFEKKVIRINSKIQINNKRASISLLWKWNVYDKINNVITVMSILNKFFFIRSNRIELKITNGIMYRPMFLKRDISENIFRRVIIKKQPINNIIDDLYIKQKNSVLSLSNLKFLRNNSDIKILLKQISLKYKKIIITKKFSLIL